MEEIEVKVIDIDKKATVAKLLEMGAKKVFDANMHNIRYDFEDGSLQKDEALLGLRKKGDKKIITYKKMIEQGKARIMAEIETEIDDFESMDGILKAIKLKPIEEFDKHRTSYKLNGILFEIDEYKEFPAFMEIEAPDIDTIYDYARKLGIDEKKIKNWTTTELFEHYKIADKFKL